MKTKIRRYSRKSLSVLMSIMVVVSALFFGSITSADATLGFFDHSGNKNFYLYYDDSKANISNSGARDVYLIIGHNSYSSAYKMSKLDNTALFYYNMKNDWTGLTGFCFGSTSTAPSSGTGVSLATCKGDCTESTNTYTSDYAFYGNSRTYYFTTDTSKNITPTQISEGSDSYGSLKNKLTLKTKQKAVGESSYSAVSDTNIVIPHIQSCYWNSKTPTSSTTSDSNASHGVVSYDNAVAAASTTFSYSSLSSDYELVGWYDNSGNQLGTGSTYSFFQTGQGTDQVYWGYYTQLYTVSVADDGNGTATVGGSSSAKISQGSTASIVATPSTGYAFDYWEVTAGEISETAASLTASDTVTPTGSTAAVTLTAHFKPSNFTVNIVTSVTGGTASPASYSGLEVGDQRSITATATPNTNYVFANWTASPAANIVFADASSASTTFTANGPATITPTFTTETLYSVSVTNGIAQTTSTVNAGSIITPELTAADLSDDDYAFTGWTFSGDVQLAEGYSASDSTIKIKATGTGGSVTANYSKYIYFYGAVQDFWTANQLTVKVNNVTVQPYAWIAQDSAITLKNSSGNGVGAQNHFNYFIAVYRVPSTSSWVGKTVTVTGVDNPTKLQNANGYCYYTYAISDGNNTGASLSPQGVTTVTLSKYAIDGDHSVTINKTETHYGGKTAGQDEFTYVYEAINQSTNAVTTLDGNTFTPDTISLPAGTYKIRIRTYDTTTGKMTSSAETSQNLVISSTPNKHKVIFNGGTGITGTPTGSYNYNSGVETGSITSNSTQFKTGSVVTLTYTLADGYTDSESTITVKDASDNNVTFEKSGTSTITVTFTLPDSDVTVVYQPKEIMHTVTIVQRYYDSSGSDTIAANTTLRTVSAGIATSASTGAAPTVTDYTFWRWTTPSSNFTLVSGSTSSSGALTVRATDDVTIYIDYKETVYTATIQNDGNGVVKLNAAGNAISSTSIGNVTYVSLIAVNNDGYGFDFWEITPASGKTVTIKNGGTTSVISTATGSTAPASGDIRTNSNLDFKMNGAATIKAHFKLVPYSISAAFANKYATGNSYSITDTSGNTIDHANIGETFEIHITLAAGYELSGNPTFSTGTGYRAPNLTSGYPTTSGNIVTYRYTMNAGKVSATITLKAKKPTLSNVQFKNNTSGFPFANYNSGATVPNYYKQPMESKATTDSFAKIVYTVKSETKDAVNSDTAVSYTQPVAPNEKPTGNGYTDYEVEVKAKNSQTGVDDEYSDLQTFTIRVYLNDAQKKYDILNNFKDTYELTSESESGYYDNASAEISAYNTAFSAAETALATYPDYDATAEDATNLETLKTNLENTLTVMLHKAKTTTVYVLTKYTNNASEPINVNASQGSFTSSDWKHYKLYSHFINAGTWVRSDTQHLVYEGSVTKSGTRYLYSLTYAGHASLIFWKGNSAIDVSNSGKGLTNSITSLTSYDSYYVNAYDTTAASSPATVTPSNYSDFNFDTTATKAARRFEPDTDDISRSYTMTQIMDVLNLNPSTPGAGYTGSMRDAPTVDVTVTDFEITGPSGRTILRTSDSELASQVQDSWKPRKAGLHRVTIKANIGTDARSELGAVFEKEKTLFIWVTADDIDIYIDMNSNVGTPTVHFTYFVNGSEEVVNAGTSGAIERDLPYELDLVTGSESIYKYTVKQSKLRTDYKITSLKISSITVDNITAPFTNSGNGYEIAFDSTITGEAWFKADSTNVKSFSQIGYNSMTKTFRAVLITNPANDVVSGIENVSGTGIITDDETTGMFEDKYTVLEIQEGTADTLVYPKFTYNVHAAANEEATYEYTQTVNNVETTISKPCYFVKWVKIPTASDGTVSLTGAVDVSTKADFHINSAPRFNDGDETYVALYKLVEDSDAEVRVEITYHFNDYDTSDGNYIYDADKGRTPTHYTKTVKVAAASLDSTLSDYLNADSSSTEVELTALQTAAAKAANELAENDVPKIRSSYFDYTFKANSAEVEGRDADKKKIRISASLTEAAHDYHIFFGQGTPSSGYSSPPTGYTGKYEQVEALTTSVANPAWYVRRGTGNDWDDSENVDWQLVAKGKATYKARYGAGDGLTDSDTLYIMVDNNESPGDVTGTSLIRTSYNTFTMSGTTEKVTHNFYIIDFCEENHLKGGGVVFGTTADGRSYRNSVAGENMANSTAVATYVNSILDGTYDVEYKTQTIKNTGFRYLPFSSGEDVFRYSEELGGYHYYFPATNNNSQETYGTQTLRVYSFFIKDDNTVVVSPTYAEVSRYIAH